MKSFAVGVRGELRNFCGSAERRRLSAASSPECKFFFFFFVFGAEKWDVLQGQLVRNSDPPEKIVYSGVFPPLPAMALPINPSKQFGKALKK